MNSDPARLLLNAARLILLILVVSRRVQRPVFAAYLALFFVWFIQWPVNEPARWLSDEYILMAARVAVAGEALHLALRGVPKRGLVSFFGAEAAIVSGGMIAVWGVTEVHLGAFVVFSAYVLVALWLTMWHAAVFAPRGRLHCTLLAWVLTPQVVGAMVQPYIQMHPNEPLFWGITEAGNWMGFLAMLAWIWITIQRPEELNGRR